ALGALLIAASSPFWVPDANSGRVTALAVAHLTEVVPTGRAFTEDLALVRAAVPVQEDALDTVLDEMAPYAPAGMPSVPALRHRFELQSGRIVAATMGSNTDQDW